ncbi:MAG: hypothetical protein EA339_13395 [Rhodobacteraceae bacterium]|nr:MAG: hypothetical protein EA339_13395 [Paracoccaceae bacterium]
MKADCLVQFKLMIPAGLKARVEASAQKNRRSLSQEIVRVLEEQFPTPTAHDQEVALSRLLEHLSSYPDSEAVSSIRAKILRKLNSVPPPIPETEFNALLIEALSAVQADRS